jgi:membrane protein DedA with SNARE-associated domain
VNSAWESALTWFSQHESLFIFLAILFEESGIPMPLPADLAMALAGFRVAQGQMSLLEAFLIGQAATLIGSSALYWVGRRGGRALLFRYGKYIHVNAHRIGQAERLITRLGPLAVIIGRQVPGLRLAAPLACGVFRVPFRQFLPAMFVGSSLYIGVFIGIGMWGGPAAVELLRSHGLPLRFLASTLLLLLTVFLLRLLAKRARDVTVPIHRQVVSRRQSLEAGLIAGLVSSAVTSLAVTWLLELVGLIAGAPPERGLLLLLGNDPAPTFLRALAERAPQRIALTGLALALPAQIATHVVWALLYAFVFERRLRGPASVRGLQFSLLPWLVSGLVFFPLVDAGVFGFALGGALPVVTELVRNAVFGVTLGTLFRLVSLARQPRLHSHPRHGHRHQDVPAAIASSPSK